MIELAIFLCGWAAGIITFMFGAWFSKDVLK